MWQPNNPYQTPGQTIPNWNSGVNYQMQPQPNYYQPIRPTIFGRTVGNESEIVPNEVPMDGSVSYFPTSDGSSIYAKKWRTDGTIQTLKFVPVVEPTQPAAERNTVLASDITADIQLIADRLSKIEDLLTSDTTKVIVKEGLK